MPRSTVILFIYPFPPLQISRLTRLTSIDLDSNSLSGTIPSSVSFNDVLGYPDVMPLGMPRSTSVYTNTMVCHDHIVNTCCISAHVIEDCVYMMQCMGVVDALPCMLAFLVCLMSSSRALEAYHRV